MDAFLKLIDTNGHFAAYGKNANSTHLEGFAFNQVRSLWLKHALKNEI